MDEITNNTNIESAEKVRKPIKIKKVLIIVLSVLVGLIIINRVIHGINYFRSGIWQYTVRNFDENRQACTAVLERMYEIYEKEKESRPDLVSGRGYLCEIEENGISKIIIGIKYIYNDGSEKDFKSDFDGDPEDVAALSRAMRQYAGESGYFFSENQVRYNAGCPYALIYTKNCLRPKIKGDPQFVNRLSLHLFESYPYP